LSPLGPSATGLIRAPPSPTKHLRHEFSRCRRRWSNPRGSNARPKPLGRRADHVCWLPAHSPVGGEASIACDLCSRIFHQFALAPCRPNVWSVWHHLVPCGASSPATSLRNQALISTLTCTIDRGRQHGVVQPTRLFPLQVFDMGVVGLYSTTRSLSALA